MTEYVAKTFHGLEGVLEKELQDLGATQTKKLSRAVAFEGDEELLYRANINLRTALRILQPIATDRVANQNQLYNFANSLNWLRWFTPNETFAIHANVFQAPEFNNSAFVALKVKDAIVDQFRKITGQRPSVDKDNPNIRIEILLYKDQCTISIDSSGDSLHRRGYRQGGHRAPLNEVLAAGMVLISGWDKEMPLIDPFCGSGTILTEAAMIAKNKAPNVKRDKFGFSYWKNFDKKLYEKAWLEARASECRFEGKILGSDISPKSIELSGYHLKHAGVDDAVALVVKSFDESIAPEEPGVIIANPPYGERMRRYDMERLYSGIGDKLKADYTGYAAWIISSMPGFHRMIGLRPSKKMKLFNGGLECDFMKFEMYSGSRRD